MENNNNVEKKTKGRQKIEIKKIPKKPNRQVTFSKRRVGLLNKASELCILCGAEAAIITFSPGRKCFTFGHPSVENVLERYLTGSTSKEVNMSQLEGSSKRYVEALAESKTEKDQGKMIEEMVEARGDKFWWEEPIEDLEVQELEQYVASIEKLKKIVAERVDKMEKAITSPSNYLVDPSGSGESKSMGTDD